MPLRIIPLISSCRAAFKTFPAGHGPDEMHRVLNRGRALILICGGCFGKPSKSVREDLGLSGINRLLTRWAFEFMLIKRAYTKEASSSWSRRADSRPATFESESTISLEVWLHIATFPLWTRIGGPIFFPRAERSCQTMPAFRIGSALFLGGSFARGTFVTVFVDEKSSRVAGRIFPWRQRHPPFSVWKGLPSKAVTGSEGVPAALCLLGCALRRHCNAMGLGNKNQR